MQKYDLILEWNVTRLSTSPSVYYGKGKGNWYLVWLYNVLFGFPSFSFQICFGFSQVTWSSAFPFSASFESSPLHFSPTSRISLCVSFSLPRPSVKTRLPFFHLLPMKEPHAQSVTVNVTSLFTNLQNGKMKGLESYQRCSMDHFWFVEWGGIGTSES